MTTFNKFHLHSAAAHLDVPPHMRKEDTIVLIENQKRSIKMTKAKVAILLVVMVVIFALIFTPGDAYPAAETTETSDYHLNNGSRLVITNVVKTIEFEVGVVDDDDDDDAVDNNSTSLNDTGVYETDIQLLNLGLLKKLVNEATEDTKTEKTGETTEETLSTPART